MTLSEFDLIDRYFTRCGKGRADVLLGIGDDAALLRTRPGQALAVTQDTLVEGVHFLPDADPGNLGHKCLAVNLSDLAAMGAEPAWVTLALTLPAADAAWLGAFSRGFCSLAEGAGVRLVGGDTTRGPLSISVTALGQVPAGAALGRSGAAPGDLVCVTGTLGDAGLALRVLQDGLEVDGWDYLHGRLETPQPRVQAGLDLRGLASAAIDVSDGLLADLGHILAASRVGAVLELESLPCSAPLRTFLALTDDWTLPLAAGDDYELCFTLPRARSGALDTLGQGLDHPVTVIGKITAEPGLRCLRGDGSLFRPGCAGYDHFRAGA